MILCSCKKDKVDPVIPANSSQNDYYPVSAALIPLLFDTNSYWIYSNGSLLDTVNLISVTREELYLVPHQPKKDETFIFNYHSNELNNYTERAYGAIITRFSSDEGWVYATNLAVGGSCSGLNFVAKLDTLIVGSQEYYNVSKMRVQQGSYFPIPNDMYLYYCDSVGVIRREVLSGNSIIDTWDLIQSNIFFYPY